VLSVWQKRGCQALAPRFFLTGNPDGVVNE